MDVRFLFERGHKVTQVARAAGVSAGTASKWRNGLMNPGFASITKLHGAGLLTDDDLRRAGLALPSAGEAPEPRPEPRVELDPVEPYAG